MYTIQALWTAPTMGSAASSSSANNGSYKLLKLNIQQYWRSGMPEHDFPGLLRLLQPEITFDLMAQSMGVGSVAGRGPNQIGPALDAALADDKPFLIDLVLTDGSPDTDTCVRSISQERKGRNG